MVNAEKHKNKYAFDKVKEAKFENLYVHDNAEGAVSGTFEIPENMLDLEGVEYLLKLNIFNEVPTVLTFVAPTIVEYSITSKASEYSEEVKAVYVEKATKLIENIIGCFKEFKIDLYDKATDEINLAICSMTEALSV